MSSATPDCSDDSLAAQAVLLFSLIVKGDEKAVLALVNTNLTALVNVCSATPNHEGRGLGYTPVKWAFLHAQVGIALKLQELGGKCPGVEGGGLAMAWD